MINIWLLLKTIQIQVILSEYLQIKLYPIKIFSFFEEEKEFTCLTL